MTNFLVRAGGMKGYDDGNVDFPYALHKLRTAAERHAPFDSWFLSDSASTQDKAT